MQFLRAAILAFTATHFALAAAAQESANEYTAGYSIKCYAAAAKRTAFPEPLEIRFHLEVQSEGSPRFFLTLEDSVGFPIVEQLSRRAVEVKGSVSIGAGSSSESFVVLESQRGTGVGLIAEQTFVAAAELSSDVSQKLGFSRIEVRFSPSALEGASVSPATATFFGRNLTGDFEVKPPTFNVACISYRIGQCRMSNGQTCGLSFFSGKIGLEGH